MLSRLKELYIKYRQFIVYSIIGASGAGLDIIVFLVLFNVFKIDKTVATIISTSLGIINNFVLNVLFNFKIKENLFKRFISFYSVGLVGLGLTVVLLYVFVDIFKFNTNLVKFISIFFVVLVQYNLNKKISFRNKNI